MEITEDWVRGLTGWKPFKEGKAMAEQSMVAGFKQAGGLLQGTLREGRQTLRPVVKIAGPSDVRVQCGCAEHRATGGVCAHAVAVLLAGIVRGSAATPADPVPPRGASPPADPVAWEIHLSPRLATEGREGKISARLVPAARAAVSPADRAICEWLVARGAGGGPQAFRLDGAEAADWLDRAAGHPRVRIEASDTLIRINPEPEAPLRLALSRLEKDRVVLELDAAEKRRRLIRWGTSPAVLDRDRLARLPAAGDAAWLRQVFELAQEGRLVLEAEDFVRRLDAWMDLFESPHPGWLGGLRLTAAAPRFELELEGSLDALDATLSVRYPGLEACPLPDPGEDMPGLPRLTAEGWVDARQPEAEELARRRLISSGFGTVGHRSRFQLRGRDAVMGFLADHLPALRREWRIREGERFRSAAARVHVLRPEIEEFQGRGGSLSFELSFQTTAGQRIPATELRRILAGGKRRVTLKSGAELIIARDCDEVVQPLLADLGIARMEDRFQPGEAASILLQNLRENIHNAIGMNAPIHSNSLRSEEITNVGLSATLRPYQTEGAGWLVSRLKRLGGALLSDEMGLGKTIQTIACINHLKRLSPGAGPALVVAPTSLLGNWMAELKRFAPELKCLRFHGAERDHLRDQVDQVDLIVTSYQTLARDLAFHLSREYRLVVADEASLLRNPDAEISKALARVRAHGRIALTGTPVENRVDDLWSIFRFIAPGYLGDRVDFRERYAFAREMTAPADRGLERLRWRISPFVLRRTKDQVAKDLPDKVEIDEWLTLSDKQAELYASVARAGLAEWERVRERQGEGAGRMHLLTLLLRLRQICVDPELLKISEAADSNSVKIERLLELLQERFENGLKTLVFSQFAENLRGIQKRLGDEFGQVFRIDGSVRDRQKLVDSFQTTAGPAVFLISLKAGGYGLNLTAADTVVHLDPWWNPAVEAQATDRAHRIGQTRPVTVYRFLTRDTVEERVRRMQDRKRAIIEAATGSGEDESPQNWTTADLTALLA
jgi:superfamily II DNA or RNA helicase